MRILIANRGEIARRIQRTAHALGHETVAAWADPDAQAPFVSEASIAVRLGPAAVGESYLSVERLIEAARRTGSSAVHPGYGFLAENAAFARAVQAEGLVWVGPHADAIETMGSKIEARRLAAAARVPVIPGFAESQEPDALAQAAGEIGYPVLVKAAAGGGGKGIRIVHDAAGFEAALTEATREAESVFGDRSVIVERYVQRPRHVEVQVVGDRHGRVIELGTRECSVQRRYQKLLEEAPAPNLPDATRKGLRSAARELARSIGYDSTGTVEFIVDDETGDFFFLEMNTRLQVEHPVTEAVTGLDLVELQIRVAEGEPLPLDQADVALRGHAFEARINAEDPAAGFAPRTGCVTHLRVPEGVRFDSGIELGSVITPHYDPMLAKLVVAGPDRAAARRRLLRALDELVLGGLVTNAGFQRWLIGQPDVVAGRVTTRFLDEAELPGPPDAAAAAGLAARAWAAERSCARGVGAWAALGPFRVTPHRPAVACFLEDELGGVHEVVAPDRADTPGATLRVDGEQGTRQVPVSVDGPGRSVAVVLAGYTHTFRIVSRSEHWAREAREDPDAAGAVAAPFPGVVSEVAVRPGQAVAPGDVVVVIEAMKMLHSLAARGQGVVAEVRVAAGDSVESNQVLVTFESEALPIHWRLTVPHRNVYMTDELQALYDQTVEFVTKEVQPKGDRWEEEGKVPREILRRLGELGMLGLRVPEALGGVGLGPLASATFSEALGASTYAGFDVTVLVHTDMAGPHLVNSGSPEQHARFMPGVLSGETILSIAVSEPGAGSDVAGLRTQGVRDGDGWRINGRKTFITNAVYGDMSIVAARTDPDNKYGISMFLVPAGTEGFQVDKKLDKHGWRCSDTAELVLEDVWVPDDQLLGTPHRGFYETMKNFQNERMVLVGMGVGAAQRAIEMTLAYTQQRQAFGGHLFDLGAIRQRMAMNQAKVDAVRASMYHAAWLGERGGDNIKEMSGVKAWGCELVNQVMYDCVQFHGGMGYMRESAIERMYRDARVLPIGGGATEVMLEEVAKRSLAG